MIPLFTVSLAILCGVSLYAALNHLIWFVQRAMDRVHLYFGLSALAIFAIGCTQLAMLHAGSVAQMSRALSWNISALSLYFMLLPWLVAALAAQNRPTLQAGFSLAAVLMLLVNLLHPFSLQYVALDSIHSVAMPWGENLYLPQGRNSNWLYYGTALSVLVNIFALHVFYSAFRRTRNRTFLLFMLAILVYFALGLQGILVRTGNINFPQLGIFGYFGIIMLMSLALNRDAHRQLVSSEHRFKSLVDQAPLSILLISPQGRIIQVNRAFEKLWGVSADKILDYDLLQDQQLADKGVLPYLKQGLSGQPAEVPPILYNPAENPLRPGPESDRLVRAFIYPIKDAKGKVREITMLQEDITERLQLQRDLAEREHDLRAILDNVPAQIGYWDKTLHNRFANQAYAERYAIPPEKISGMHISELLGDEAYRATQPYIEKALQGEAQQFERSYISPDKKTQRHALAHYIPDILHGEVRGFFVLVFDVSALKNSERRLARSQEIALIGSWEMEVQTGKHWWSDQTYRIFGTPPGEPLSLQSIAERIFPEDREQVLDAFKRAINDSIPSTFAIEHRITLPAGGVKWVNLTVEITHDTHGMPLMFSGTVQDITGRKFAEEEQTHLQQQLLQAQKMEAIGHLTGGIAHDFNNMLNAILGYTHMLKQLAGSSIANKTERTEKYLTEILTAANRAKDLIKQMQVFSRQNTDKQNDEKPVTLIAPVLQEVISMLRSSIPSTIKIDVEIADAQCKTRIQPVQLHQILLNLVINARDAIAEYGQIRVGLACIKGKGFCHACNKTFSGDFAEISVSDNGSGIPEQFLGKIFEPFFTTKAVGKGTGMGLAVVHGHVHALGGHIALESTPGAGTTIRILLPLAAEYSADALPAQTAIAAEPVQLSGLRVMVVDDEQVVSSMLNDLLSLHGASVQTFNRSQDALDAFRQSPHQFDIIVTDETMPELSGIDMAKTMLQLRPDLPVILCTGYSEKVDEEIARASGIAEFVYKPVDMRKLMNRISELCRSNEPARD